MRCGVQCSCLYFAADLTMGNIFVICGLRAIVVGCSHACRLLIFDGWFDCRRLLCDRSTFYSPPTIAEQLCCSRLLHEHHSFLPHFVFLLFDDGELASGGSDMSPGEYVTTVFVSRSRYFSSLTSIVAEQPFCSRLLYAQQNLYRTFIFLLFDDGELASNGSDILFGQFETFVFVSEGFVVVVDCWRNYQVRSFYFTSRLVVVFLCLLLFAIAMPVA